MLIRKLDPPKLCNDTRFMVNISTNRIKATMITGCASGGNVFYSINVIKSIDILFEIKQKEFPA